MLTDAPGSAGNRLTLEAGRRGRSDVASPSLDVWSEGGELPPGAGGRRGIAGVVGSTSRWWLWPLVVEPGQYLSELTARCSSSVRLFASW